MSAAHTPTPWRVRPKVNAKGERILNRIHPSIEGPQGESVASLAGPYRHGDVGHIVRCVNERDALVVALRDACDALRVHQPDAWAFVQAEKLLGSLA